MTERKIDRRALKTRKAVFDALAELLVEKELRQITVQELSDKADIHRVTLYKHFYDIYDVYEQLEQTILNEVAFLIADLGDKPSIELYNAVLNYITENPKYFNMIFSPHNTGALLQKLQKMFEGIKRMIWAETLGVDFKNIKVQSVIRYHASGCFAVLSDWVTSGFKQPREYIIHLLSGLEKSTQLNLEAHIKNSGTY